MASYISLHMRFAEPHRGIDILRAARRCEAYSLKAVGAMGEKAGSRRPSHGSVIAGWSIEHFMSKFARRFVRGSAVTTVATSEKNRRYLESVLKPESDTRFRHLYPFEESVDSHRATLLTAPELPAEILDGCERAMEQWNWSQVMGCGTFRLAVQDPGDWNWSNAHRMIYEYPEDLKVDFQLPFAFPFISLNAYSTPDEPDTTLVTLYSGSFVWLRGANDLRGHIGVWEADENLMNLVELAAAIANNGKVALREATLDLEGNIFWAESKRIGDAFGMALPFTWF